MISIALSFISYLISVVIHVLLHRYLVRVGKKTFASVGVFFIGLVLHAVVAFRFLPLPWTSTVLYGLLSWLHIIVFTESYYGDMGPSRKILAMLRKKHAMTYHEIVTLFSDQVLIENRIHNLERDGLIRGKNGHLCATKRGRNLHRLLQWYRALFHWESSG